MGANAQLVVPGNYTDALVPIPGYQLYWTVNQAGGTIDVGIIATGTGWVGFGIGTGMTGSDIIMATNVVTDRQGTGELAPPIDPEQNLISSSVQRTATETHVKFSRLLQSPDPSDLPFSPGVASYICAWNPTTTQEFEHSPTQRIRFFAEMGGAFAPGTQPKLEQNFTDSAFVPPTSSALSGTEVTFRNLGTITQALSCPTCPQQFNSPNIAGGATWSRIFTVEGSYRVESSSGHVLTLSIGAQSPTVPRQYATEVVAHSVLMGLAWGFFAPIAIWAAMMDKGKEWWFPFHYIMAGICGLFTVIGFALIVVHVGNNHFWNSASSPTSGAHGTVGLVLFILFFVQIILGVIIHFLWQSEYNRTGSAPETGIMDYIHHFCGRIIVLAAFVQICLGIVELRVELWIIAPVVIVEVAIIVILVIRHCTRGKSKTSGVAMNKFYNGGK